MNGQGSSSAPQSIRGQELPTPRNVFPSPGDNWQSEVIYFLLPDRFSDGNEAARKLLDRNNKNTARAGANWQNWSNSGSGRWQGGTLNGVKSKLSYLKNLGATALWIGPVFRQRKELNTFHGYAIQGFLEVDPRFGTASDLVDLVEASHKNGIRLILDIVFNHSGDNWLYANGLDTPPYQNYPIQLDFGKWRDATGNPIRVTPNGPNDGVWPIELQDPNSYMRAGQGSLDSGPNDDPNDGTLPYRRSDFPGGFRKFNHYAGLTLSDLALCYKYWIGLTDCDGFRIDTVKHIAMDVARAFTGAIKEYAASIGKTDFFLVAEIGGGDVMEADYLDGITQNKLNAALDIGSAKGVLRNVGKGLETPSDYFNRFATTPDVGESRKLGSRLVSVTDDHDNLNDAGNGQRLRFSYFSIVEHQILVPSAIQLFTLSIPCIYYGSEQALSYNLPGTDVGYQTPYLVGQGWGYQDWFLREAMFGPEHPLQDAAQGSALDPTTPGFGPFGTSGYHCFDESNPVFVRFAHLLAVRQSNPALRTGRQYQRPLGQFGWNNLDYPSGQLIAWSRILADQEMLIVVNGNGGVPNGADVLVDFNLNGPTMKVIANTAERAATAAGGVYAGPAPIGSTLAVNRPPGGPAYITIPNLPPAEVLILMSGN